MVDWGGALRERVVFNRRDRELREWIVLDWLRLHNLPTNPHDLRALRVARAREGEGGVIARGVSLLYIPRFDLAC